MAINRRRFLKFLGGGAAAVGGAALFGLPKAEPVKFDGVALDPQPETITWTHTYRYTEQQVDVTGIADASRKFERWPT